MIRSIIPLSILCFFLCFKGNSQTNFYVAQESCFEFEFLALDFDTNLYFVWTIDGNVIDSTNSDSIRYSFSSEDSFEVCLINSDTNLLDTTCEIIVTDTFQPKVLLLKDSLINFCKGRSAAFSTDSIYFDVLWMDGTNSIDVVSTESEGVFYQIFNEDSSCIQYSDTIFTNVQVVQSPTLNNTADSIRLCNGSNLFVIEQDDYQSYKWNENQFGPSSVSIDSSGYYFCEITDTNGCIGITDSIYITIEEVVNQSVCNVTFDTLTHKSVVKWEQNSLNNVDHLIAYKISHQQEVYLGNIPSDESQFIDQSSSPFKHINQYLIRTVDTCGNTSTETNSYASSLLTVDYSNDTSTLSWSSPYIDSTSTIHIRYGIDSSDMTTINTISNQSNFKLQDTSKAYYQIIIEHPQTCESVYTNFQSNGYFTTIIDDTTNNDTIDFIHEINQLPFSVYPNPSQDVINITSNGTATLKLFNVFGKEITSIQHVLNSQISMSDLSSGNYLLMFVSDEKHYVYKVSKK